MRQGKAKTSFLMLALLAGVFCTPAMAETIITDTVVKQRDIPDTKKVNFIEFDVNGDGQLSRQEVGQKLFYIFDTDGNMVIDNIEYGKPMVMTIIPMVKQQTVFIDFDDDGYADQATFNEEDFFKRSLLYKFAQSPDGLSGNDFLSQNYWQVDDNGDKVVDVGEWESAYIESTRPEVTNPNLYNN